jgi:hypothetical protein
MIDDMKKILLLIVLCLTTLHSVVAQEKNYVQFTSDHSDEQYGKFLEDEIFEVKDIVGFYKNDTIEIPCDKIDTIKKVKFLKQRTMSNDTITQDTEYDYVKTEGDQIYFIYKKDNKNHFLRNNNNISIVTRHRYKGETIPDSILNKKYYLVKFNKDSVPVPKDYLKIAKAKNVNPEDSLKTYIIGNSTKDKNKITIKVPENIRLITKDTTINIDKSCEIDKTIYGNYGRFFWKSYPSFFISASEFNSVGGLKLEYWFAIIGVSLIIAIIITCRKKIKTLWTQWKIKTFESLEDLEKCEKLKKEGNYAVVKSREDNDNKVTKILYCYKSNTWVVDNKSNDEATEEQIVNLNKIKTEVESIKNSLDNYNTYNNKKKKRAIISKIKELIETIKERTKQDIIGKLQPNITTIENAIAQNKIPELKDSIKKLKEVLEQIIGSTNQKEPTDLENVSEGQTDEQVKSPLFPESEIQGIKNELKNVYKSIAELKEALPSKNEINYIKEKIDTQVNLYNQDWDKDKNTSILAILKREISSASDNQMQIKRITELEKEKTRLEENIRQLEIDKNRNDERIGKLDKEIECKNIEITDLKSANLSPTGVIKISGYENFVNNAFNLLQVADLAEKEIVNYINTLVSGDRAIVTTYLADYYINRPTSTISEWNGIISGLQINGMIKHSIKSTLQNEVSNVKQVEFLETSFFTDIVRPYVSSLLLFIERLRTAYYYGVQTGISEVLISKGRELLSYSKALGAEVWFFPMFKSLPNDFDKIEIREDETLSKQVRRRERLDSETIIGVTQYAVNRQGIITEKTKLLTFKE